VPFDHQLKRAVANDVEELAIIFLELELLSMDRRITLTAN
jgi:hypothetical protein